MRALDLAWKDLKQIVRDWKAAVFLLAMPMAFTVFIGYLFGGFESQEDPRLPVGYLNQDAGGTLAGDLLDLLESSDAVRPVVLEDEALEAVKEMVREGELAAAVIVPTGYSRAMLGGQPFRPVVVVDRASTAGSTALDAVQAVVMRLTGALETGRLTLEAIEAKGGITNDAQGDQAFERTVDRAIDAWADPPVSVTVLKSSTSESEDESLAPSTNRFAHSSPAMMVQFSITGLMGAAQILVAERKSRALKRLLTTAISRAGVILGHFLAMFVLILAQVGLLVAFGQLALGVDYFSRPAATVLLGVSVALWSASMGLLIGVLAKTEEHVIIYTLIPMFLLSALGGAWMPLEVTGKAFQTVGHLTPTAWIMDGFKDIVIRGLGLGSVLPSVGILWAYAVLLFALAVWRFRFE